MALLTGDLGDIAQDLMNRVATLEQRITSPLFTLPNGSTPTFPQVNIGQWRGIGATVPIGQLVGSPTNLAGTPVTTFDDVAIDATWSAPADGTAVQYQIDVAVKNTTTGIYSLIDSRVTSGTNMHVSGLDPLKTYGIRVSAINRIGVVSAPYPVSGWVDVATNKDASVPVGITGLQATAGATSIMLTWNESTDVDVAKGQGYYEVEWTATNPAGDTLHYVTTSATLASFTGLDPAKTYGFRVRAYDSSLNSGPWTAQVTIAPGSTGGGSTAASDGAAPASSPTPTLIGSVGPVILVKFPLVANADPVTYEIHVGSSSTFTADATTKCTEVTTSNIVLREKVPGTPLAYNTAYWVRIVAKDRDGSAAPSAAVSVTVAPAGTNDIGAGAITASSGIIASLDATTITTGTMSGNFITANTLSGDRVVANTMQGDRIIFNTLNGDRIVANSLDVTAIKSSTLSTRTITLASDGQIIGGTNPLGVLSAQTGFIFNGGALTTYKGGATTFRLDFSNGNAYFAGDITGSTGTFSGSLTGSTITGSVLQTSTSATLDRITIDPTSGMMAWREATVNFCTEPYFVRIYAGDEMQTLPGDTIVGSAWTTAYPAGGTYSNPGTGVTAAVNWLPKQVKGYPVNPIGAPQGALRYNFGASAQAGVYTIRYDANCTVGQPYTFSYYMAVSTLNSITNLRSNGFLQWLDSGGALLGTYAFANRLRDNALGPNVYDFANVWERYGASMVAPAGAAKARLTIQIANLASTGGYVGSVYVYGAQLEQKDHATPYCDGNQYNCLWTSGRPGSASTRSYDAVGKFGGSTGLKGSNIMVGSVLGGRGDRVIAGIVATTEIDPSSAAFLPNGGGVALGTSPSYASTQTWNSGSNVITFIPEYGQWGDYNNFPYIQGHTWSSVGATGLPGGYEYPMEIILNSGTTAGAPNNYASIELQSGYTGNGSSIMYYVTGTNSLHNFQGGHSYFQGHVEIGSTADAGVSGVAALMIGAGTNSELVIDANEIVARSGGAGSALGLNRVAGGDINMSFSGSAVHNFGDLYLDNFPTSSSAANTYMSTTGRIFKSTSSRRYKTDIRPYTTPFDVLDLDPVYFRDKARIEEEGASPLFLGLLAEDVHIAGFEWLVEYHHETGAPEAVQYDRLAVALIPVIRDLRARVTKLESKVPAHK